MTADVFDIADAEPPGECWCCGRDRPMAELLGLNEHSEVAICLGCAEFLGRRAGARRDELHPSKVARARDVLRDGRRIVVEHGWQDRPVLGALLRKLGRHLP